MEVKVCDALCGSGKTSACINMMNQRTETKFIFVTQYLSEVERIKSKCSSRGFVAPASDIEAGVTKLSDIHQLMKEGRNIATTHSLFVSYTEETKRMITEQKYVLILDEVVDVMCPAELSRSDLKLLIKSNALTDDGDCYSWTDEEYDANDERCRFREEMLRAKSKNFLRYDENFFFWAIPPELFTCFSEAYILTYMFHSQTLRCFFDLYGIEYKIIGAKKDGDSYVFCDVCDMDRSRDLRDRVHILEHEKLNAIGESRTALSFSWYRAERLKEDVPEINRIRKNVTNVFKNIWKAPADKTMWTTFKDYREIIENRGYKNSFVTYNKRASNDYCDRKYLAYCVNNFPRPWESKYFRDRGVEVNGDTYALSILIQWMFRSAIRRDEEIWIYVPSMRMRRLLKLWLDQLADGNDLTPINYRTPRKSRAKTGAKRGRPAGSHNKNKGE